MKSKPNAFNAFGFESFGLGRMRRILEKEEEKATGTLQCTVPLTGELFAITQLHCMDLGYRFIGILLFGVKK